MDKKWPVYGATQDGMGVCMYVCVHVRACVWVHTYVRVCAPLSSKYCLKNCLAWKLSNGSFILLN